MASDLAQLPSVTPQLGPGSVETDSPAEQYRSETDVATESIRNAAEEILPGITSEPESDSALSTLTDEILTDGGYSFENASEAAWTDFLDTLGDTNNESGFGQSIRAFQHFSNERVEQQQETFGEQQRLNGAEDGIIDSDVILGKVSSVVSNPSASIAASTNELVRPVNTLADGLPEL